MTMTTTTYRLAPAPKFAAMPARPAKGTGNSRSESTNSSTAERLSGSTHPQGNSPLYERSPDGYLCNMTTTDTHNSPEVPAMTVTARLVSIRRAELTTAPSLVFGLEGRTRTGLAAVVEMVKDGAVLQTLHLDRLDGEDEWFVNSLFNRTSPMPAFHNGLFSRCTMPVRPHSMVTDLLDAEVA